MRRLALPLLVAVLFVPASVACSSGDDDSPSSSATVAVTDDARDAAVGVCSVLVTFDDTVATEINAASRQILRDTDPQVARDLLLEATANIQAAVDALPDDYAALGLSEEGDVGQLVRDASATTAALDEQLDTITAKLTDGLPGADARGVLSATFIDMEKVQSLAQPDQGDYADPALVEALDTTPACEHTISR